MAQLDSVQQLLDWHQVRRSQSVATVSVLVGPAGLGVRAWRGWAGRANRPVAQATSTDPMEIARLWVAAAFAATGPVSLAANWLTARLPANRSGPPCALDRMTRYDLDTLWRTLPTAGNDPVAAVAYAVFTTVADGRNLDAKELVNSLATAEGGIPAALAGVCGLGPDRSWPGLLLVPSDPRAAGTCSQHLLPFLEAVTAEAPALPVGLVLSQSAYEAALVKVGHSRIGGLAREGRIELAGVSVGELSARLHAAGVAPPPPATLTQLTANGLAPEVAEAFVEAAVAVQSVTTRDGVSDFRSVHERFLFEQLESLPETAGLFRPNRALPFRHGPQTAEADLLAEALNLVVEVDGRHYHLNEDQYRRDRRKDWLYQRHGYWVLRFLAEDVVADLETILATVLEAVALRRSTGSDSEVPTGD